MQSVSQRREEKVTFLFDCMEAINSTWLLPLVRFASSTANSFCKFCLILCSCSRFVDPISSCLEFEDVRSSFLS